MMEEEIYVSCHAPSLSLLLFETARSIHDQKGLLIGQVCNEIISKKTDENERNCEHKTTIYLEHCIPVDDQDIIENAGCINESKFKKLADVLQNKIVGWYSFRRNSKLTSCTLSELIIHKSLLELMPNVKCQYFVACFLSSSTAANMSTHTFNHVFMSYDPDKAKFESLRLKIYTLSDKSVNSNGYLVKNSFPTSRSFDKIINYNQKEETPVKSVLKIHERVSDLLKQIERKLQNEDNQRLILEEEVEILRKRLNTGKRGNILVEEPEKKELKMKTLQYNPNKVYATSRKLLDSDFKQKMSYLTNQSVDVMEVFKHKKSDSLEVSNASPCQLSGQMPGPSEIDERNFRGVSKNYSKENSCVKEHSYLDEKDEKKKKDDCKVVQEAKSMEY